MSRTTAEKRAAFRSLHESGCFVLPNPWDVGSARMLEHMGFVALASTSSGFAWSTGKPDYAVERDDVLRHLTELSASVDLPVNADFEAGFANDPSEVASNVALAIATGIAGISIEDRDLARGGALFDPALTVERVKAARSAIDASGTGVVLVGRTEGLLDDPAAAKSSIDRLVMLAEAGADCLYAPGVRDHADIAAMVRAVAPRPLNVLAMSPDTSFAALRDLGVRRVSIGGSLARVAWKATRAAAEQLLGGSFAGLTGMPGSELNAMFGERR